MRWIGDILVGSIVGVLACSCMTTNGENNSCADLEPAYGFRYDPMKWVKSGTSLESAMVRCAVFKDPKPGDVEKIRAKLREEIDKRNKQKVNEVEPVDIKLLEAALDLGIPEKKELGELLLAKAKDCDKPDTYLTQNLCLTGFGDEPAVQASLKRRAETVLAESPWRCCPWGPYLKVSEMWHGRNHVDASKSIDHLVTVLEKHSGQLGNIFDKDPWGLVNFSGLIDHPLARHMVMRAIPMIVRGQHSDGGWGNKSYIVFRALQHHGLIGKIKALPSPPPDWKIVRSIPAPAENLHTLGWDGKLLWTVKQGDDSSLYAISPKDGNVVQTIALNDKRVQGVGCWDGKLLVTAVKPNEVREVDPKTGKLLKITRLVGPIVFRMMGVAPVGDKIWAVDNHCPAIWEYDPKAAGEELEGEVPTIRLHPRYVHLAGPGPTDIAVENEDVWSVDWMMPLLLRSNSRTGHLSDWGEQLKAANSRITGITHDGRNLWILDSGKKCLTIIKRNPESTAKTALPCVLRDWLICGPIPAREFTSDEWDALKQKLGERANGLGTGHGTDFLTAMGGEAKAQPTAGQAVTMPDGKQFTWQPNNADQVMFSQAFPRQRIVNTVMYAYREIPCNEDREVLLAIGSDDAVKVWLNGELVHDHQVARAVRLDDDIFPVSLKKGTNHLLIKVENTRGEGGLIARFVRKRSDGKCEGIAIAGLKPLQKNATPLLK